MNVLPNRKANIPEDRKCEFAVPFKPLQAVQDLQNSSTFCDFAEKGSLNRLSHPDFLRISQHGETIAIIPQ